MERDTESVDHRGGILWLTGLSGAGKSTLATVLDRRLSAAGWRTAVLDGDELRRNLCRDLSYSPADRAENIRRAGCVAHLFAGARMVAIAAFISPYQADRDLIRALNPAAFHEIHIATALAECERRDPKGLYRRARDGLIADFTGISAPYEPPLRPELRVETEGRTAESCVEDLAAYAETAFRAPVK